MNGKFRSEDMTIQIKYGKNEGTMDYYTKPMTIIQATQQYLTYGQQMVYRLATLKENVETVLGSTPFFFIAVNSLDVFPNKILSTKKLLIDEIEQALRKSDALQGTIKIVMGALVLLSIIATISFYRYLLNNYILRVLAMYEQIKVEKIAEYRDKCSRYRLSLKGKEDKDKDS